MSFSEEGDNENDPEPGFLSNVKPTFTAGGAWSRAKTTLIARCVHFRRGAYANNRLQRRGW